MKKVFVIAAGLMLTSTAFSQDMPVKHKGHTQAEMGSAASSVTPKPAIIKPTGNAQVNAEKSSSTPVIMRNRLQSQPAGATSSNTAKPNVVKTSTGSKTGRIALTKTAANMGKTSAKAPVITKVNTTNNNATGHVTLSNSIPKK